MSLITHLWEPTCILGNLEFMSGIALAQCVSIDIARFWGKILYSGNFERENSQIYILIRFLPFDITLGSVMA